MATKEHKGGSKAALFVYVMATLESMAYLSNLASLVIYFSGYMNFGLVKSATTLTNFLGTANLLALFGGFICDTYLSRFRATILFGFIEILGFAVLAMQAHVSQLRPLPCKDVAPDQTDQCEPATQRQEAILFVGLYLFALGTGAIKAALASLGGDQFDENDPEEAHLLSSYFNWYFSGVMLGAVIGVIFLVWISDNLGWDKSFGLCIILLIIGIFVIAMGNKKFRHIVPKRSPIVVILQVISAAVRNRNLPIPEAADELYENNEGSGQKGEIIQQTNQFRFLDKASIVTELKPWKTCTVTQVEEVKIIVRMLPLILSTVFMNTCLAQLQTFSVQQSTTMNRHILSLEIPGPSIQFIPLLITFISLPLYDKLFVPLARRITGIPLGIRRLQRIGVGLVLSIISMAVAGIIETKRKSLAYRLNMVDTTKPLPMSVFWLAPQYGIFGLADAFATVGMLDFFYAETSAGMKSLGSGIALSSISFGYFLSTVVVDVVDKVTKGWLASNNLNRDKLNYFYWLLSVLSLINFGFYLLCSSWYKCKKVGGLKKEDETLGDKNDAEVAHSAKVYSENL